MACSSVTVTAPVITLKRGLAMPLVVLQLLWSLEDRGFDVARVGDRLQVRPGKDLNPADLTAIHEHRDELLALIDYADEGLCQ